MPEPRTATPRARRQQPDDAGAGSWPALALAVVQGQLGGLGNAKTRAGQRAQVEADRIDRFLESRIEDVLNRINIPSRSDIERLNRSVDVLTHKVETLLARQTEARSAGQRAVTRARRG